MIENIKRKLLSSRTGQIAALAFAVYTIIWTIVEPLNIAWINSHSGLWRIILITLDISIVVLLSVQLSNRYLEIIDMNGIGKNLLNSFSSTGNPS
jgi:hypothetical protein